MIIQPTVPLPSIGVVEQVNYDKEYEEELKKYEEYLRQLNIEEGEIMKPLETDKLNITSGYGDRKKPLDKTKTEFHYGVDLTGGKKIIAVASGRVVKVVNSGSKGGTMCIVRIQHKSYQSAYYHCKSGSVKVKVGQWVEKGTHIATIGNTGKTTGTHLHFQIDKGSNSTSIDPTEYAKGKEQLEGLYKVQTNWEPGDYRLLKQKYLRTSPKVSTNKYKWKGLKPNAKLKCDKDEDGYAKYKIGAKINIKEFDVDNKGNVWGRTNTLWVCVHDDTGDQVMKI